MNKSNADDKATRLANQNTTQASGCDITRPTKDGVTQVEPDAVGLSDFSAQPQTSFERGSHALDLYEILSDPIKGGMGQVFKVHHKNWDTDLALKQPHAHLFQSEQQKEMFTNECEAWIELGLHPHIVSCYYVRQIDGIPSIFSEWVDGGSLADWIQNGRLHQGSPEQRLMRILDIAIQYVRGLNYAHENLLIHQDVKPDNLLLTSDGTAKVADFGIAQARTNTLVAQAGAYTPAYCSPEQMSGTTLTGQTDIWSWGVTLLEMIVGERPWPNGVVAGTAWQEYLTMSDLPIAETLEEIFEECFAYELQDRYKNFSQVEEDLLFLYEEQFSVAYDRKLPQAAPNTADSINNRALSYLDIGKVEEAKQYLQSALGIDSAHPDAVFNNAMLEWRTGLLKYSTVIDRLESLWRDTGESSHAAFLLGHFFFESLDYDHAASWFEKATAEPEAPGFAARSRSQENIHITNQDLPFSTKFVLSEDGSRFFTTMNKQTSDLREAARSKKRQAQGWVHMDVKTWAEAFWGYTSDLHTLYPVTLPTQPKSNGVVISNDFKHLLINDGSSLSLFELSSGKVKRKRYFDEKEALHRKGSMAFSPDSTLAFVALSKYAENSTINFEIWDTETGTTIRSASIDPQGNSYGVAFDPGGLRAYIGQSYLIKVVDLVTTGHIADLKSHDGLNIPHMTRMLYPKVTSDGHSLIISDKNVEIWDTESLEKRYELASETFMGHVSVDRSSRYFAIAGSYGTCAVYELASGRCLTAFAVKDILSPGTEKNSPTVAEPSFSADGSRLFFLCSEGSLISLSLPLESAEARAYWSLSRIISVDESEAHTKAFSAVHEKTLTLLDEGDIDAALEAIEEARELPGFWNSTDRVRLSQKVGAYCKRVGVSSIVKVHTIFEEDGSKHFCFSPRSTYLSTGRNIYRLEIEARPSTTEDQVYARVPEYHKIYCFSADESEVVSVTDARAGNAYFPTSSEIHIYGMDPFAHRETIRVPLVIKHPVKMSVDKRYLLLIGEVEANKTHHVMIWDRAQGSIGANYTSEDYIREASFTADEAAIIISTHDRIYLWDRTSSPIESLIDFSEGSHQSVSGGATLSSDGSTLLIAARKDYKSPAQMIVFDLRKRRILHQLDHEASSVNFLPQSRFSWIENTPGTQEIWDFEEQKIAASRIPDAGSITDDVVDSSGNYVLTRDGDPCILRIEYEYEFPGWSDWNEGVRPYLENHIACYPTETAHSMGALFRSLQSAGYGWIRPEGIASKLKEMRIPTS